MSVLSWVSAQAEATVAQSSAADGVGGRAGLAAPGFDWDKVKPDPGAVPKSGLFYDFLNGLFFLGIVFVVAGLIGGLITFVIGPVFGAHILSDRGKSMMWKAVLGAIILGSATSVLSFLVQKAGA